MNKHDADKIISDYVRRLFGFAMSKLSSIDRAEELAAEITLQVYQSLLRQDGIVNTDGYIYRIARNVYARYIDGKNRNTVVDGIELIPDERDFTAELAGSEDYGILRREITYLSGIQREIIVDYYFHDKKIREIAQKLQIPENTVKWHLACSRRELKTGMEKIRTTGSLGTQPIRLVNLGHNGCPGEKGDTSYFLAKSLTQNIAYAAYHTPRTVNEIAEELGVNPIFVEDEVKILEEYGFMDKLSNGKYRTNIMITIPSKEVHDIYKEINKEYAGLFAEKFFAPVLEGITEIPDWLHIPDNDANLVKWCAAYFLAGKLATADASGNKYSVKRPDGEDYAAFATVEVTPDWETDDGSNCGGFNSMQRGTATDNVWWESRQFNNDWAGREKNWKDNLNSDYDKLYYFLKGNLPETAANAESYARLLEKGYLLKKSGEYRCNLIICDSKKKWQQLIPDAPEEITEMSRQYASKAVKAELINQPLHMHEQIKYFNQNAACSLINGIIKLLLDKGVLKLPTEEQAKGLCTIMFMGE